jgi:hypothetical protein
MPHHASKKYSTGTACATHKKCSRVMSGKRQAKPKDPTVKTTSPTTPNNARLGKAATSMLAGCGASDSEADGDCCTKVAYLASDFQVSITLSGLSEIEVIP